MRVKHKNTIVFILGPLLFSGFMTPGAKAQQTSEPIKAVHLVGLDKVKDNAKGTLSVERGQLRFIRGKESSDVSIASILDVVSGADTQKAVGKAVGTMSMAAPYGGGRFLSLFRKKIDTLTIQYHDADGGLHGAIFTMAPGGAEPIKKLLVAPGAHVAKTEEPESAKTQSSNPTEKEQKQ